METVDLLCPPKIGNLFFSKTSPAAQPEGLLIDQSRRRQQTDSQVQIQLLANVPEHKILPQGKSSLLMKEPKAAGSLQSYVLVQSNHKHASLNK